MSDYYDRRFQIDLDGNTFIEETGGRQFRVVFTVLSDFGGYVSYAEISIYGLSTDTEKKAFRQGQKIDFKAGYKSSIDYIFRGEITNILKSKQGPDRVTKLICLSGAINRKEATIVKEFGKGSPLVDILEALAESLSYPLAIDESQFEGVSYDGFNMNGSPVQYLKSLSKANNFNWVIENNRLVVVEKDSFRPGVINEVSQFTGMIGAPEITERGADVNVKLSPKIKIGGRFNISSEFKNFNFSQIYFQRIKPSQGLGVYNIQKIEHSGDSYGDDWSSKITGYV